MSPDLILPDIFDRLHVLGRRDDLMVDNEQVLVEELEADMAERFGQDKRLRVFDPLTGKVYSARVMITFEDDNRKFTGCPSCGAKPRRRKCGCGYEAKEIPCGE